MTLAMGANNALMNAFRLSATLPLSVLLNADEGSAEFGGPS